MNDAEILNATVSQGYYCVNAKHTPIFYDIIFNFNGGSGTVPGSENNTVLYGYGVEKTYDLSRVNVTNAGKELTGWVVTINGVYSKSFNKGVIIGYIPGASQNSRITITAQWDSTEYTITYILNEGIITGDNETTQSYFVDQLDGITLPTPVYKVYPAYNTFLGWYENTQLTQRFDFCDSEN